MSGRHNITTVHNARPPLPVLAAMALLVINAAAGLVIAVEGLFDGEPLALIALVATVISGLVAVGLWRGSRAAYVVAIALGILVLLPRDVGSSDWNLRGFLIELALGGLLIGLLVVPARSRAHFARR